MKLTAKDMKENKLIDGIIPEPLGGAHLEHEIMALGLKKVITETIAELSKLTPEQRISQRIDKFCSMGVVIE